ncbi:MAG: phosphosulfolactate synthase [Acidimicrobiaceae bacterium]|nr:phosphosulfolactate synthase [Acidimicrobiaceae bacterium]
MSVSEPPRFLELADRTAKPRRSGVTHVIDKGMPAAGVEALLTSLGTMVDVWKFGFGTAYVDPTVASKIEVLRRHSVKACPGGTLLEAAWLQGRTEAFFDWAGGLGFDCVEVSRGATGLPAAVKRDLIVGARTRGFEVFAEVGSKDSGHAALPDEWGDEARRDIDSGASWLVAEGRESGTAGLYDRGGAIRAELVDALETLGDEAPVIYEAPRRDQQAWLINRLGANANLANIAPDEVLAVEALRLGLRVDTMSKAPLIFQRTM